jgi:mono/diheme cytochrome c family protein
MRAKAMFMQASWFSFSVAVVSASFVFPSRPHAQTQAPVAMPTFSSTPRFAGKTGADIYASACQACHMPDGKGATGAAIFPALAGNKNLAAGRYAVNVIVGGRKGMPPFGGMMSDEQIVAVVNYIRTQFGNSHVDTVTIEDVASARH